MNITERLMQLDPTLERHNEGFWNEPYNPGKPGYSSFNDAGVECETGEFLYSMVRILKPRRVLETGTHVGVGAAYMGMALFDNNQGNKLHTIEFIKQHFDRALERMGVLGLHNTVESYLMDVKDFDPGTATYGLIFLDTEPITRFSELVKFYEHLEPGGFLFIHDTPRTLCQGNVNTDHPEIPSWPFGNIPNRMLELVKNGELRPFHFPTPRGLVGFYKVHPDDLKWQK